MTTPYEQSGTRLADLMKQPEIESSLVEIIEGLPNLAMLVRYLSKACDISREALHDGEMLGALDDVIHNVRGKASGRLTDLSDAWQEAKRRAGANYSHPIGVFGLMRMLKDPVIQRNLHLVEALLQVLEERQHPH